MAKKKKKSAPESKRAFENYKMETGLDLGLYMAPNLDLGKDFPSEAVEKLGDRSVRKIVVNGEETLINNRKDDPNP